MVVACAQAAMQISPPQKLSSIEEKKVDGVSNLPFNVQPQGPVIEPLTFVFPILVFNKSGIKIEHEKVF